MLRIKVFLTIFAIAAAYSDVSDKYHAIIVGDRLKLKQFYECLLDISPCDLFGKQIKSHLIEVLKDSCRECDPTQTHYAHILITLLKTDYPDMYEAFEAKYDPQRQLLQALDTKTKDL